MTVPEASRSLQQVPLELLAFDPSNPRLPRRVDGTAKDTVIAWMLEDASLIELMGSIGAQGFFEGEPILAVPAGPEGSETANQYVVIEGNRRLAAALLLRNPKAAPARRRRSVTQVAEESRHHPTTLPTLLFEARDDVVRYLGFRHVTGIKEWDTLAKARYVALLAGSNGATRADEETRKSIARVIGSRPDYVGRLLSGHALFDHAAHHEYYRLEVEDRFAEDFSLLTTALSYEAIARFIGLEHYADTELALLNDENYKDLLDWLYVTLPSGRGSVVGESRNLRELAAIVDNSTAIDRLREHRDLEEAALLTEAPLALFEKTITEARDRLSLAQSQFFRVSNPRQSDGDILLEIGQISRDLRRLVQARLDDEVEAIGD